MKHGRFKTTRAVGIRAFESCMCVDSTLRGSNFTRAINRPFSVNKCWYPCRRQEFGSEENQPRNALGQDKRDKKKKKKKLQQVC